MNLNKTKINLEIKIELNNLIFIIQNNQTNDIAKIELYDNKYLKNYDYDVNNLTVCHLEIELYDTKCILEYIQHDINVLNGFLNNEYGTINESLNKSYTIYLENLLFLKEHIKIEPIKHNPTFRITNGIDYFDYQIHVEYNTVDDFLKEFKHNSTMTDIYTVFSDCDDLKIYDVINDKFINVNDYQQYINIVENYLSTVYDDLNDIIFFLNVTTSSYIKGLYLVYCILKTKQLLDNNDYPKFSIKYDNDDGYYHIIVKPDEINNDFLKNNPHKLFKSFHENLNNLHLFNIYDENDKIINNFDEIQISIKQIIERLCVTNKPLNDDYVNGLYIILDIINAKQKFNNSNNSSNEQNSYYDVGGIEVKEFCKAKLTHEQLIGAYLWNIIKYSSRFNHKHKNDRNLEEANKILNYSQYLVDELKNN